MRPLMSLQIHKVNIPACMLLSSRYRDHLTLFWVTVRPIAPLTRAADASATCRPRKYQLCLLEQRAQRFVRYILDGFILSDRQVGGEGAGLAERHEHRLHADRAVGNVGGGEAELSYD